MSTQPQPAPVLAWHNEAALEIRRYFGKPLLDICETDPVLPYILAAHDPHAETVRLLEEAFTVVSNLGSTLAMMSSPDTRWESPMMTQYREHRDAIHAHLAKLKGTQ